MHTYGTLIYASIQDTFALLLGLSNILPLERVQSRIKLPISIGGFDITSIEQLAPTIVLGHSCSSSFLGGLILSGGETFLTIVFDGGRGHQHTSF